ncbi:HAD family hydrolase [Planococcus halotolerans]|uniref:HAD family hydrolase n=1 Tax=Planococcus halotolerans TaxID=2233542 RepID=UPI001092B312|nr:HAD family hydrolase [Planococcus halotolerans]QHJ72424.1 HAD-IA family hydrolase [Planococcus halotolerans]
MKTIIFDFDGTLANTLPVCDYAFQHVFREFDQRELSSTEIRSMFGPSETGIIRKNLLHADTEEAIELYYAKYLEQHTQLVGHNHEIHELLLYLKEQGLKLGIVTGKARRSLDISLKALQMEHFFDAIITGDDVNHPKPDPEGVLKAIALLDASPQEAMFIGDSDADIQAGIQAGVFTVGVHWLPDYQTLAFAVAPNSSYKTVSEFMVALQTEVKHES